MTRPSSLRSRSSRPTTAASVRLLRWASFRRNTRVNWCGPSCSRRSSSSPSTTGDRSSYCTCSGDSYDIGLSSSSLSPSHRMPMCGLNHSNCPDMQSSSVRLLAYLVRKVPVYTSLGGTSRQGRCSTTTMSPRQSHARYSNRQCARARRSSSNRFAARSANSL